MLAVFFADHQCGRRPTVREVLDSHMSSGTDIRLATVDDALSIARMSRDLIERGLGWSWTPLRVRRSTVDAATNVALAIRADLPVGFGIMRYRDDGAPAAARGQSHACAAGDRYATRRLARGGRPGRWIGQVYLGSRPANSTGREFYRRLDYAEIQTVRGYHGGVESSVRMAKDLWLEQPASA